MTTLAAVLKGLEHAKEMGYEKPLDVAISVEVALNDAGYKIIRMNAKEIETRAAKIEAIRTKYRMGNK